MSLEKDIKIYLVGFPKSGTSWLIRLMANLFEIPVKNNSLNKESTIEINNRLNLKSDHSFIAKVHLLPNFFSSKIDPEPEKIIYIYRDIRAVLISAFFYFKIPKSFSYLFLLKRGKDLSFVRNLSRILLYPLSRYILSRYINEFLNQGINGIGEGVGIWQQNIQEWSSFIEKEAGEEPKAVFISYEKLLDDPFSGVLKITKELNLPELSEARILKAIKSESFEAMKTRLNKKSSPTEFAKLRVGTKEDWRNYLTYGNLTKLKKEVDYYQSLL
jgi:hypothetical protein